MYLYFKPDGTLFIRSKKRITEDLDSSLTEMLVDDDLILTKEGEPDSEGIVALREKTKSEIENSLTYANKRVTEYPSIEDQLDKIYHEGIDAWKADIQAIKDKYPKS
jgi:hypothetical protein|tara:strand:- start:1057 stop:1377 length:321 start_codon:yes stop_codon:yes gene_type:complete